MEAPWAVPVTGRHRHRRRPGLTLPANATNEGWRLYSATSGDLDLATRGDFHMAKDRPAALASARSPFSNSVCSVNTLVRITRATASSSAT